MANTVSIDDMRHSHISMRLYLNTMSRASRSCQIHFRLIDTRKVFT